MDENELETHGYISDMKSTPEVLKCAILWINICHKINPINNRLIRQIYLSWYNI